MSKRDKTMKNHWKSRLIRTLSGWLKVPVRVGWHELHPVPGTHSEELEVEHLHFEGEVPLDTPIEIFKSDLSQKAARQLVEDGLMTFYMSKYPSHGMRQFRADLYVLRQKHMTELLDIESPLKG